MPALQIVAARLSGVHRLDLHALGVGGPQVMQQAVAFASHLRGPAGGVGALIDAVDAAAFSWGQSDGNWQCRGALSVGFATSRSP